MRCGHAAVSGANSWPQLSMHLPLLAAPTQSWMAAGSNVLSSSNAVACEHVSIVLCWLPADKSK